jgi:hypothetical protein
VVAHVALRRLLRWLEVPRMICTVAQRLIDHPAPRLAFTDGCVERRHVPTGMHLRHELGNKGSIFRIAGKVDALERVGVQIEKLRLVELAVNEFVAAIPDRYLWRLGTVRSVLHEDRF